MNLHVFEQKVKSGEIMLTDTKETFFNGKEKNFGKKEDNKRRKRIVKIKSVLTILAFSSSIACFFASLMFLETDRRYCVLCASTHLNITIKEAYVLRSQYFAELDFLSNFFLALGIVILISWAVVIYIQNSKEKKQE